MKSPLYGFRRFGALFRGSRLDAELEAELAQHLEAATADNMRKGMTADEAGRQARLALGGVDQIHELHRDTRGLPWLEDFFHDTRHAARSLRRSPGFALAAVLTLALGLAVNLTLFSVASDVFLRPLPVADPDRLVVLAQSLLNARQNLPLSYPDFEDFRRQVDQRGADVPELAQAFTDLMAYKEEEVYVSDPGTGTGTAWIHLASNNYFSVLGVKPQLGRFFLATEGRSPGADPIIVLSDRCWRDRFGADRGIVGKRIHLNGLALTVVGVAPRGFVGASWGASLTGFVPMSMILRLSPARGFVLFSRGDMVCFLVGRLRSGVSIDRARAAANLMMARLVREYPGYHAPAEATTMMVLPEDRSRPSPLLASYVPLILGVLTALACLVLAIAAANVANLLYARAVDREHELALRAALGGSRARLLRHLLTESVLLALAAGLVGLAGTFAVQRFLNDLLASADFAPPANMGVDWRLFAFAVIAAVTTGVLTGLLPALKATGFDILPLLKSGAPTTARASHRWRSLLVVGQVSASCIVLVCAGLAVRSLQQLDRLRLGFRPDHLLVASLDLERMRYSPQDGARFQAELRDRLQALPGVISVSLGTSAPFDSGIGRKGDITAEGRPPRANSKFVLTPHAAVDHRYVETTGLALADGRGFTVHDTADRPRVAVISTGLARDLWPQESAIGKRFFYNAGDPPIEVVGILGKSRLWDMTDSDERFILFALSQRYDGRIRILVRTEGDPLRLVSALREVVHDMDAGLPLLGVRTMEDQMANSPTARMPSRVGALVAGAQGLIALLLAALGVFGLVWFSTTRRTREIGIRMAMGAGPGQVIRVVALESLRLVVIGLALGLLLAFGLARRLDGILYGVAPADPVVFLAVPALVLVVALLACCLPARRALAVDPLITLRAE